MSNIKSEALVRECSKKKFFSARVSFIIKLQAESIKPAFPFYPAQVFSSEICENLKNTFENTNNFVKHLRTAAPVKCYL